MIQTVSGPIPADALGVTLAHEHLLIDLRCLFEETPSGALTGPVGGVPRDQLEAHPYRSFDNLVMDDEDTAVDELVAYGNAGGRSLIDMTVEGIGPNPRALRRISERTGIHVIAGTGVYRSIAHTAWVREASVEELAERFVHDVRDGIAGTEVKAGLLGELGTSSPIHPAEVKVLQSAARAHVETGVPINVHCALFDREGGRVLDILEAAGVDPGHVGLSHMDELLDFDYHRGLAERGAWLSFDTFGSELPLWQHREPRDEERIQHLLRLLDAGFSAQILLSQDVCTKMQLRRYGGSGYASLLTRIVPMLRQAGISGGTIEQLLVDNPRRYLEAIR
jgi:phosphotriesterase-related protein